MQSMLVGSWRRSDARFRGWEPCCCKRTDEKNKLPTLVFAQLRFEDGHGLFAFADFIEQLAIGDVAHEFRVGEIGGRRVIPGGVPAVAFTGIAVALCTLILIYGFCGFEYGGR